MAGASGAELPPPKANEDGGKGPAPLRIGERPNGGGSAPLREAKSQAIVLGRG